MDRNGVRKKSKKLSKNQLLHGHHCDRCDVAGYNKVLWEILFVEIEWIAIAHVCWLPSRKHTICFHCTSAPLTHTHTPFTMQYVISNILGSIIFIHLVNWIMCVRAIVWEHGTERNEQKIATWKSWKTYVIKEMLQHLGFPFYHFAQR